MRPVDDRFGRASGSSYTRPLHLVVVGVIAFAGAMLCACSSSKQTPRQSRMMPDTPSVSEPPPAQPSEPTIGEQLGRLDARMRTAPADSLPALQAQYQRLLDQAAQKDRVQTGVNPESDAQQAQAIPSTPREPVPPSEMRGFRQNEIRQSAQAEAEPAAPVSHTSTSRRKATGHTAGSAEPSAPVSHTSTNRRTAGAAEPVPHLSTNRRTAAAAEAAEPVPHLSTNRRTTEAAEPTSHLSSVRRPSEAPAATPDASTGPATPDNVTSTHPAEATSNQRDRKFINGLAASRAGHYAEAAAELPEVVASPPAGKKNLSQYSYAQSLEKTGSLSKAADQYLKASKGSEELSDKSYISYCRVLAKSGERSRARQLLAQFVQAHPKSTQVVNARRLLQTL